MKELPYLEKTGNGIKSLIVDRKPYMGLGGEMHNSGASDSAYMDEKVWPAVKEVGVDTLFFPAYWEVIEPLEGKFDFSYIDSIIKRAEKEKVHLVMLWFGLWKNGESFYVPSWVKVDVKRFFRAEYKQGAPSVTISPLCHEAVRADKTAFVALMRHLNEVDGKSQNVIAVQVENEIGFLRSERDFSKVADGEYHNAVPQSVAELYSVSGDWHSAFREDAAELFMAYSYAKAVEEIASAGKSEYALPMYVNAWLEQFPKRPGAYPSGGPIAKVMKMWKNTAHDIDIFAPDIYLSDFVGVCDSYTQNDNPLFIPEARRDAVTASNVFYAFGHYNAICFSPFAFEDFFDAPKEDDANKASLLEQLNIEAGAFICTDTGKYLAASYLLLKNIKDLYLDKRENGKVLAFIKRNEHESGTVLHLLNCDLKVTYMRDEKGKPGSAGMVIEGEENDFWILGTRVAFELLPHKSSEEQVSVLRMEEGCFEESVWITAKRLNGDELMENHLGDIAEVKRIAYYKFV